MNPTDQARLRRPATLVVRSGRMGDFLVAVPALAALRRRRPEDRIVLLTGISQDRRTAALARRYSGAGLPPWVQWFEGKLFDEVIGFGRWNDPAEWRGLRGRLGAYRFRDAFVLPYFSESRLRRWQKHLWLRSLGHWGKIHSRYNEAAAARPPAMSLQTWAALDVVARGLGVPEVEPIQPAMDTGAAAQTFAAEFWRQPGLAERPAIAMFPAGTFAHKRWPAERFAQVAGRILAAGAAVVFVGSEADRAIVRETVAGLPSGSGVFDLTGRTSLAELAAVLGRCAGFVGNDGGPAHLAAAAGVPCVTIMSGVHCAGMWDPTGAAHVAVRHPTPCYGCRSEFDCPEGTRACVDGIGVEQVWEACVPLLAGCGLRGSDGKSQPMNFQDGT
jgi:ADP-heptose:LPS heptosyltransferase